MAPRLRLLTALTLLGALLLFSLEPLVGRLLLPSCGGSFHVWATCLMAFQATLFLGYLYCHLLAPRLGRWHLAVAATPLLFLPIVVLPEHSPQPPLITALSAAGVGLTDPDSHRPIWSILRAFLVGIAVPFGVLATTGVVAQAWLARSDLKERADPYPLYAASNLGSLVALLGYPLLIEPFVSLRVQRVVWSLGFLVYLWLLWRAAPPKEVATPVPPVPAPLAPAPAPGGPVGTPVTEAPAQPPKDETPPTWRDIIFWLGLAAAPSMFLTAVTNVISVDIGSLPLVWVVPLGIYLLSFVLVFGQRSFYPPILQRFWPEIFLVGAFFYVQQGSFAVSRLLAFVHLGVLFVMCIVGHGELHRSRPAPRWLTLFYLMLSLGGGLGGAFVCLVAPRVLTSLSEYLIALGLLALTLLWRHWRALPAWFKSEPRPLLAGSAVLCLIVLARTTHAFLHQGGAPLHVHRDVYGVYRITERGLHDNEQEEVSLRIAAVTERLLIRSVNHGTTLHGAQVMHPEARRRPISYYHELGPMGDVMAMLRRRAQPLDGGIIGLGAGASGAYFALPGDSVCFYELDPDVETMTRKYFTYLQDAAATNGGHVRCVIGDARLKLANDPDTPPGGYDIILVDAFSSDAIPVHLLTREALTAFSAKLAPDGVLLYHVSNRYYDLQPALVATARTVGLVAAHKSRTVSNYSQGPTDPRDWRKYLAPLEDPSDYIALGKSPGTLEPLLHPPSNVDRMPWTLAGEDVGKGVTPWSDDFANLLGTLRGIFN